MSRRRLFGVLAVAGLAAMAPSGSGFAAGKVRAPTLVAAPAAGRLGDIVSVTLEHWPVGLLSLSVCGNAGRRGSQDCDLRSASTVSMPPGGAATAPLPLVEPPVGCPCVIRAATLTNGIVLTTPVTIEGVPVDRAPAPAATSVGVGGLTARARIVDDDPWTAVFGVGARRNLRVTLDNHGPATTPPLQLAGGAGRDVEDGEGFASTRVAPIAAGEVRTVNIPIDLSAPAHGDYVVFGTVYGLDTPVRFQTDTSADPWALELAIPLLVLLAARMVRRRERRRAAEAVDATHAGLVLEPFPECSPEVGNGDEGRYPSPSYDPHDRRSRPATHAASLV